MPLSEVLAGLQQAEHLARLHHQHWAADACAQARARLDPPRRSYTLARCWLAIS